MDSDRRTAEALISAIYHCTYAYLFYLKHSHTSHPLSLLSMLESSLRSFNNLLERFHHSFWFYLKPNPNFFLPLGMYIGPVVMLSAAVLLHVKGLSVFFRKEFHQLIFAGFVLLDLLHLQQTSGQTSCSLSTTFRYFQQASDNGIH